MIVYGDLINEVNEEAFGESDNLNFVNISKRHHHFCWSVEWKVL